MPLSESSCEERPRDGELLWSEELPWLEESRWLDEPLMPEERSDGVRPDVPDPPEVSAAPLVPLVELLLEPSSLSAELPIPSSF